MNRTEAAIHENALAQTALEMGGELAGSVSGAAVGFLLGGPPGAILGAVVAVPIKTTLVGFAQRLLNRRERIRVGAALSFTLLAYEERLKAGDSLRDDGFFVTEPSGRSAGEELIDAVVAASQVVVEEKKIPYLGYLLANIGFEPMIDRALANRITRIAEGMTWSQFVLLSAIGRDDVEVPAVEIGHPSQSWSSWGIHQEVVELLNGNFVGSPPDITPRFGLQTSNMRFQEWQLASLGRLVFSLAWLDRIPRDEIDTVLDLFSVVDA